jgi:hypothetical protein
MTVEAPQKAPPGGRPDKDRRGPRRPTVKEPASISFPAIPAVEQPAQTRDTAELPVTTAVATDVYARRALATPRSRHSVRNRIIGFGIAGGLTVAGAFGLRAAMSQPGGSPDISPTHPPATDTFKAPVNTPRVEITPDHFPLSPKTIKYGGINIVDNPVAVSEKLPYGYNLVIFAPTIETVKKNPDGSEVLTVVLPGGALKATDMHKSVKNFDGTTQEEFGYNTTDTTQGNTVLEIYIPKDTSVMSDKGYAGQAVDKTFTVGSADWDFTITPNYETQKNLPSIKQIEKAAETGAPLDRVDFTVGYISPTNFSN